MNAFRKIIGLIILIFLGLPLLFGIIWAVGLTKTAKVHRTQHHAVDHLVAERFDNVEGQTRPIRPHFMVEPQERVESQRIKGRPNLVHQQHVAQAQQGVDRVTRWPGPATPEVQ